jgi:hypothetical protein
MIVLTSLGTHSSIVNRIFLIPTFVPLEKMQEGPLDGAENSTRTPGAGRSSFESFA